MTPEKKLIAMVIDNEILDADSRDVNAWLMIEAGLDVDDEKAKKIVSAICSTLERVHDLDAFRALCD